MKVAGIKINLCCVVAVLIGLFIGGHLLCSCAKCDNIKVLRRRKDIKNTFCHIRREWRCVSSVQRCYIA